MTNGFLVLLQRFLVETFSADQVLSAKKWMFYQARSKLFVHGKDRSTTEPDIIAVITSDPEGKEIYLALKGHGTIPDRELLAKYIKEMAPNATVKYQ